MICSMIPVTNPWGNSDVLKRHWDLRDPKRNNLDLSRLFEVNVAIALLGVPVIIYLLLRCDHKGFPILY